MNRVWLERFPVDPPARAAFAVTALPLNATVQFQCVATMPNTAVPSTVVGRDGVFHCADYRRERAEDYDVDPVTPLTPFNPYVKKGPFIAHSSLCTTTNGGVLYTSGRRSWEDRKVRRSKTDVRAQTSRILANLLNDLEGVCPS